MYPALGFKTNHPDLISMYILIYFLRLIQISLIAHFATNNLPRTSRGLLANGYQWSPVTTYRQS